MACLSSLLKSSTFMAATQRLLSIHFIGTGTPIKKPGTEPDFERYAQSLSVATVLGCEATA